MTKFKEIYSKDGFSIFINEKDNRLQINIPGKGIDKPFDNWILDDTEYTKRILIKEINRLQELLDQYGHE